MDLAELVEDLTKGVPIGILTNAPNPSLSEVRCQKSI